MITNIDGKFMSTIYTVTDGTSEVVVSSTRDLQRELRLNKDDADAILYGNSEINGFYLKDIVELEMVNRSDYGSE